MSRLLGRAVPVSLLVLMIVSSLEAQALRVGHVRKPPSMRTAATKATVALPFTDGFESTFPGNWYFFNNPHWGTTTYRKNAGSKSIYCVQSGVGAVAAPGPYINDAAGWITYGPFSTSGATSGQATFKLWQAVEAGGYDTTSAGFSLDDVDYETIEYGSNTAGWETKTVPMNYSGWTTNYLGRATVYFSFLFSSDSSNTAEGAYIDDVSITKSGSAGSGVVKGTITGPYSRRLAGACVVLSNGSTEYQYTSYDGLYRFEGLANGQYTVTPKRPGYTFTPAQRTLTVNNNEVSGNFTAAKATGDGVVKRWALVVGIADYVGTANDLAYCDDDATDMKAALLACGYPAANIKILTNAQGTKTAIRNGINWLCSNADADDYVVFFFSGHGGQEADVAPLDEPDNLDEFFYPYEITTLSISDDEVSYWFRLLKTGSYLVMFDTCNSGGHFRSRSAQFWDYAPEGAIGTRDLDDLDGGVVLSACRDDQLSQESSTLQNGVFAYYAVQGMNNGYADANQNGFISGEEIYSYVLPRATAFNYDQTAEIWDGYPGELEFATLPTLISTSTPLRNAQSFPVGSDLLITWRWLVNQTSAQNCFKLKDSAGRVVAGTKTWDTAKKVMRFNPTSNLMADSGYTVEVTPGLTLDSGAVKWYGDKFTFKTAAPVSPGLALTGTAQAVKGGGAQITVHLSAAATVTGSITNMAGREIATLATTEATAGATTLLWSGRTAGGLAVPPGQYLVRLQAVDAQGNTAGFIAPLRK